VVVTDLQTAVASAADVAEAHSSAPSLLLLTQSALGALAATTVEATDSGRRPFRIPPDWDSKLADLAYLVYLLADQTGVSIDSAVRGIADKITAEGAKRAALVYEDGRRWH
jgi:hypothetical protein